MRAWIACRPLLGLLFRGRRRYCPLCESWTRRFLEDARCPVCRSRPRHRLTWLYLKQRTTFFDARAKRLLHFAPEMSLMAAFGRLPDLDYLSADLASPHAMVRMDITAIDAPDASFDAIYCSHVLEHVADDRKAMREMFRVLKPGGWALIMVPISPAGPTLEDPAVTDPAERERLYLQSDHVRLYGFDIRERLAEAGFEASVTFGRELADVAECERMALIPHEPIFEARKR